MKKTLENTRDKRKTMSKKKTKIDEKAKCERRGGVLGV